MSDQTPIQKLTAAVQAFVNEVDDEPPVLLRGGVVVWESMILDDDGDAMFMTNYASLDGTSLAHTMGLMELGKMVLEGDAFDEGDLS